MPYEEFVYWLPVLGVLVSVLFVNYFIPTRNRLDHSMATTLSAGVTFVVGGLVLRPNAIFLAIVSLMIVVFVADFISTFINFTNRIKNAIATAIVFTLLYWGTFMGLILHAYLRLRN